ncbi:hypothetical protein ASG92_20685 [Arthrobacter sp. Soil736]|uniref:hypothetical protein n=1 Tax=Arthrobacter sp. Soil736 TaxID=1736395 RepID=UPI0006F7BE5F|nr:hypothetical protein [Arthrobacter sp. Soil736]KRE61798.1 hypothetical protein ASG92_20685 [Arthrobacter sp. Soil736]
MSATTSPQRKIQGLLELDANAVTGRIYTRPGDSALALLDGYTGPACLVTPGRGPGQGNTNDNMKERVMPTPSGIPTEPIENDPIEAYRGREFSDVQKLLDEALEGLELGAYDARIIAWLKNWDQPTIVTLASLFVRARAGRGE